ncbi:unannotated protein [freshwater metagenome]|uniref:Unannotated protein n=1 Tax=freshwater metagenome TaxID=449393 RepID=A0A6J7IKM7_9ZZZZ|nr:hypothetical protein [Actinomycetota bacterium]
MSAQRPSGPPPVGEEIHLPPSAVQPALVALGLLLLLLGVVDKLWLSAIGLVLLVWALAIWIRDCAREMRELPVHDEHGDH